MWSHIASSVGAKVISRGTQLRQHSWRAIVRDVSPAINQCELTHIHREPINFERAQQQHEAYTQALRSLGVHVTQLPAEQKLPDSVFVEDAAIVLDECAILTRPGAPSRRPEVESLARAIAPWRTTVQVQEPGTVDGGDVMVIGKTIYVGLSSRSNQNAIDQMQAFVSPFGYSVKAVTVKGCLHLKTAVTQVKQDTVLINPEWVDKSQFYDVNFIEVDPSEPCSANAVLVENKIIYPLGFPKTQKRLEDAGIEIVLVPADELAKAEGAVTCCSILFKKT
eukprot:TRINITY_DN12800_c0_g1_i1.p1 TRINITY_DN12800_c0_g1~~TRINITY_DN12800_c0_g1_i1.p1  ORF type:complete len:279 (+),score=46.47 TRINITY_DN12800_c0_g1_i1:831-1667(+)